MDEMGRDCDIMEILNDESIVKPKEVAQDSK